MYEAQDEQDHHLGKHESPEMGEEPLMDQFPDAQSHRIQAAYYRL